MRKGFALLITITLVFPLLLSAQAVIASVSFALDRNFYIQALQSEEVVQALLSEHVLSELIMEELSLPPGMDSAEIKQILNSIVTHDYLNEQVSRLVHDFFDYLQGVNNDFEPVIDLIPLRTALLGERQQEILSVLVATLPDCEPSQSTGISGEDQTLCKPAGVPDDFLIVQLQLIYPSLIEQIPEELPLGEKWDQWLSQEDWRSFLPGVAVPASALLAALFLTFVAISFWYITALIADESWRMRLQWLGWTLMIPAILIFLVGLTASSNIPNFWVRFGLEQANFRGFTPEPAIGAIIRALVNAALLRVSSSFLIVGGISGALSLALIFWGLVTPYNKKS